MDRIRIRGGNVLNGTIPISGAKNAALPLMIASLLTDDTLTLENVPHLADVEQLIRILGNHGVDYSVNGRRENQGKGYSRTIHFTARSIVDTTAPYELVSKMRASFWVIGPLLARTGEARVSLPGGCAIGTRPVDLFIEGLSALGADIDIDSGYVVARTRKGLVGTRYRFPKVSVGATHVMLMAASLAQGQTILENAAREPEIVDICELLSEMGAQISGAGTSTITVEGVDELRPVSHRVIGDRIVAATWAYGAAMTRGDVTVRGIDPMFLHVVLEYLHSVGADVETGPDHIRVRQDRRPTARNVRTLPFPGFPTDLQPMAIALAAVSDGLSVVTENLFESRFRFVEEMVRMGVDAETDGHHAKIRGRDRLDSATVWASDIRAGAGLVLAGMCADDVTEVCEIFHVDRGYPDFVQNVRSLGGVIERVPTYR